jgi:tRNA isopentenyl-2-thiomethyl-A-37 hydroxylase MiaE
MQRTLRTLAAIGAALVSTTALAADDWLAQSNANAQPLLDTMALYAPEAASSLGVEGHDEKVFDLKPRYDERLEADLERVAGDLESRIAGTADPRVKQDLQILVQAARDQVTTSRLNRQYMLPWFDLNETLFRSFERLLDARVDAKRYPAALARLRKYTGRESGYEPITKLAQDRMRERFGTEGLAGPWTVEIEQSLANQARYVDGIREAFGKSGLKGWEKDFAVLEQQLEQHAGWVRKEMLPRARQDNRLPPAIYADNLRNFGVKVEPQALIDRALVGFVQTRDEMQAIARLIAAERKLPSSDYRDVLRALKQQTIPNDKLLATYQARLATVEEIIRREKIVSLPQRAAVIRLASEAESASIPAPHISPPQLIGNTGQNAEFVLPLDNPNAPPGAKMDDFTFDAITWALTVHEARPGHELQFARMIEAGVSIPRAVFAFNSANVEGWGLYAESVMKEYLPLDGQLATLQMRLMRAARAFLDPMINLGQIKPEEAQRFLQQEVVLSEPMAKQEADRYSFRAPGQATAYFYGYERQQAIRAKAEMALGDRFDPLSYHDFIVSQGLLPPEVLEQAVMERYVSSRKAR